jgi:ATPase
MQQILGNSPLLDKYFDEQTMSVHFKANRQVLYKRWRPGAWDPTQWDVVSKQALQNLIDGILLEIENRDDGFLEIDRSLSKVIQMWPYRIVIVYPPLSDALEMTIVKPTTRLVMADYNLDPAVIDLLQNKAKGILVSGAPGSGKTTFAQAMVDLYVDRHLTVKTIESPRDLNVSDDVVQYSFTYGSHEEIRDILLLSRPDYTVYDEVRNKHDFELYKDLRLTGIWLIWVIHASKAIDGIQRFLWTIELGIVPQVIDTVIYIDKGQLAEILHLDLVVKVPEGMMSEDLARPVVQIKSFFTNTLVYEMYSFGEQIVVVPIGGEMKKAAKSRGMQKYAREAIEQKLQQILPCDFLLGIVGTHDINIYIPEMYKARVIGKAGVAIQDLEKQMDLHIHVKWFGDVPLLDVQVDIKKSNSGMSIIMPKEYANQKIPLLVNDELFYGRTDERGMIVVTKKKVADMLDKTGFVIVDMHAI